MSNRILHLMTTVLIILTFIFIQCHPRYRLPQDEIQIKTESLSSDVRMIIALISEDEYSRLYNEVMSESLRESTSVSQIENLFESFEAEYGRLILTDSRIMNHSVLNEGIHLVTFIIQYKQRTVFAEFTFSGPSNDLHLVNYAVED